MSGYSVEQYASMLNDPHRRKAFTQAMRANIGPNTVVLDLGAGVGTLSLLACRYGARQVYAIEPNPAVKLLPGCARDNGYADRIEIHCSDSRHVELPEKVDLIIADIRGSLPVLGGSWSVLQDAVRRFLKPGGVVLPLGDEVYVAPISEPLELQRQADLWRSDDLGIDLRKIAEFRRGVVRKSTARECDLIATEQLWAQISYVPAPRMDTAVELQFLAKRSAELDGFLCWFDLDLGQQIGLSNRPGLPDLVYGRSVFSLSRSIGVARGDQITLRLKLIPGEIDTWVWSGTVASARGETLGVFKESSLKASILALSGEHPA